MKYLTKKNASLLIFGCWLVYTAAYVGRLNYSASMAEIIEALGISDPEGGLVYSCFAIAYGVGQLADLFTQRLDMGVDLGLFQRRGGLDADGSDTAVKRRFQLGKSVVNSH